MRHDGMLFASGYYVHAEDPAADTQAYVQAAIEYYQANGLDATITHYSSEDSLNGQWSLTLADAEDTVRVAFMSPNLVGTDLKELGASSRIRKLGEENGGGHRGWRVGQLHLPQHQVIGDAVRPYLGHPPRRPCSSCPATTMTGLRSPVRPPSRKPKSPPAPT